MVFCSFGLRLALTQANTLTREVGAAQVILRLEDGVEMVRDDRRARAWVVARGGEARDGAPLHAVNRHASLGRPWKFNFLRARDARARHPHMMHRTPARLL
jgi:hypothetical protein